MSRRVLVTGGAGFIGSNVTDLFLEQGWAVDIIDNLSSGKRANVPAGATLHVVDIRSEDAAKLVVGGSYDAIVHLAAQIDVRHSVEDPINDASVNIIGTLNLLEALRKSGRAAMTRFAFSSTGGAIYGDFSPPPNFETTDKEPNSPYAIAKLSVEYFLAYYARVHGLDTVAVRFGNVYGPRQDPHGEAGVVAIFCGRLLAGRPLTIYGDGLQTRDYVHVADVASAMFRVATGPLPPPGDVDERSYNVGTGVATSVLDLANTLLAVAGVGAPIEFAPKRPGELQDSCLGVDKSRAVLGWVPRMSLAEGLANTYAWSAAQVKPAAATAS
jgi:UDP-glucose 4-epimerase